MAVTPQQIGFTAFWDKIKELLGKLKGLEDLLKEILDAAKRFFHSLFQSEADIIDNCTGIVTDYQLIKENLKRDVDALRHFKVDPAWKTRVINVPIAIEQIGKIGGKLQDFWNEQLQEITEPIHELSLILKQEGPTTSGTRGVLDPAGTPSGLARAAVKVDEIATMVAQIRRAMDTLVNLTGPLFEELTKSIEALEPLFLQQRNPRARVTKPTVIRKGHLHG